MEEFFMTKTVADRLAPLGITMEGLKTWLHNRFIVPSVQKATGRGTRNIFSFEDVLFAVVFKRLVDLGIGSREEVASFLSENIGSSLAGGLRADKPYLVMRQLFSLNLAIGERTYILSFEKEIPEALSIDQNITVLVLNIRALSKQVESLLKGGKDNDQ